MTSRWCAYHRTHQSSSPLDTHFNKPHKLSWAGIRCQSALNCSFKTKSQNGNLEVASRNCGRLWKKSEVFLWMDFHTVVSIRWKILRKIVNLFFQNRSLSGWAVPIWWKHSKRDTRKKVNAISPKKKDALVKPQVAHVTTLNTLERLSPKNIKKLRFHLRYRSPKPTTSTEKRSKSQVCSIRDA